MVLYVSCADYYILNIRKRLILIVPKIVATVVLGGFYIRAIPDFDVFAYIDVAILNNLAFVVFTLTLDKEVAAITVSVCSFISVISGDM